MKKTSIVKRVTGTIAALVSIIIFSTTDVQANSYVEKEKNDTLQTAQPINVNSVIQGEISSGDPIDYFKVNVQESGRLDVSMPNVSGDSWEMQVLNEEGNSMGLRRTDSSSTALGDTTLSVGIAPGIYYVSIDIYQASYNIPYKANISLKSTPYYEKELNDTFATATPIQLNTENFGIIGFYESKDYYKFTTNEPGLATFTMRNVNDVEWKFEVLSEDGKVMESFITDDSSTAAEKSQTTLGLPAGTYYINVSHERSTSEVEYSFTLDYTVGDHFEKEFNNSIQTANFISLNKNYYGAISYNESYDYYGFQLEKDSNVAIKFKNVFDYTWRIYLLDESGKQIDSFSTNEGSTTVEYAELSKVLSAGKYYLQVSKYYSSPRKQYQFLVSTPENVTFTDVSTSHPYYEEINEVRNMGIITGYQDGTFKPNANVQRQHIAAMIIRSGAKLDNVRYSTSFADVSPSNTYYSDIMKLYTAGIIDGSVKNGYRYYTPTSDITRAQLAKILVNAYKLTGNGTSAYYSDVNADSWFAGYANTLAANGIVLDNTKKFKPNAVVTRAELAYMIKKAKDASN